MTGTGAVGIIGLGLIGGSLARDLSLRGIRVHGYDRDAATLRAACHSGIVSAPLDPACSDDADLEALFIAVPVLAAIEVLERTIDRFARVPLITDVGSTKHSIAQAAHRLGLDTRFIGAHPLAGDHRSGWSAARAGLFRGATVYICPAGDTPAASLAGLLRLWDSVGAKPEIIDAEEHDQLLAWTSHLPQAASTALARALAGSGIHLDRVGPGGRDMTRLAHSSADLWAPIALDNAAALTRAIDRLEMELDTLRDALRRDDHDAVRRFFEVPVV